MIWHFVEVWVLITVTFVIGCLLGAILYTAIAESRLAPAQGLVADHVGDALDRLKARIGLGPAWRPTHLRRIERPEPMPAQILGPQHYDPEEDTDIYVGVEEAAYVAPTAEPRQPDPEPERIAHPAVRRRPIALRRLAPPAPQPELDLPVPLVPAVAAKRPAGIGAPRGGVPDNLQRIKGIGKRNEVRLNALGIFHFGQIAAWTPGEVRWIGEHLELGDRIERDSWVAQAIVLAMGTDTGFEKSAERRRQRRRHQREFQARMASASEPPPDILPPRPYEEEPASDDGFPAPAAADDQIPDPDAALQATYARDEDYKSTAADMIENADDPYDDENAAADEYEDQTIEEDERNETEDDDPRR